MTISYSPSRDELLLEFHTVRRHPSIEFGRFQVWYEEDRICAVRIKAYTEEISEFKENLDRIRLGGIWKDVTIGEKDIEEARAALLKELEDGW
jgi:hypothetical protein